MQSCRADLDHTEHTSLCHQETSIENSRAGYEEERAQFGQKALVQRWALRNLPNHITIHGAWPTLGGKCCWRLRGFSKDSDWGICVLFRLLWLKIDGLHWFRWVLFHFVPFTRAIFSSKGHLWTGASWNAQGLDWRVFAGRSERCSKSTVALIIGGVGINTDLPAPETQDGSSWVAFFGD